jgi:hypothetical protein
MRHLPRLSFPQGAAWRHDEVSHHPIPFNSIPFGAGGCTKSAPDLSQDDAQNAGRSGAGAPLPVSVVPVLRQDVPIILTGLGTVQAYNTVTLKTRVDGEIMTVYFREGQEVTTARAARMPSFRPASCASVPS